MPLMYCRDRSTTGSSIVVPGRFDRKPVGIEIGRESRACRSGTSSRWSRMRTLASRARSISRSALNALAVGGGGSLRRK